MLSFSPRRLSRRLATSLTFIFLLSLLGAIVGEFFIELAKERGLYAQPAERLGAAVTAFSSFVTQTWFLSISACLTGLTVGLWADVALRRWEALRAVGRSAIEPLPAAEPGQLDFIVEGMQSFHDIKIIFGDLTHHTTQIVRTMEHYNRRRRSVSDPHKSRKLASKLALQLSAFSKNLRRYAPQVADAAKRTHVNCLAVINGTPILDVSGLNSLLGFMQTLQAMAVSTAQSAELMRETMDNIQGITGVSRDLNAAAQLLTTATEDLRTEVQAFGYVCEQLLAVATARAEAVSNALANPAEFPSPPPPVNTSTGTPQ